MERKRQEACMVSFILSRPSAKKCLSLAKARGIQDVLVLRAKGTVSNRTLQFLGIKSQDKVLLNILLDPHRAHAFLDEVTTELALHQPNHGIAFLTPIMRFVRDDATAVYTDQMRDEMQGIEEGSKERQDIPHKEDTMQYKKLTVVVNLGMGEEIMDVARDAGAKGGTILHGRGTGAQVSETLFGVEIEPEKELLLILAPDNVAQAVIAALEKAFDFSRPGMGILFLESVSDVRGLVLE